MTINRILVPTDFSTPADAAMAYALDLARRFGAAVQLLHVVEDPIAAGMWSAEFYPASVASLQISLVKDAEEHLRRLVADRRDVSNVSAVVRTGPAARTIVDEARALGADLVVMATTGRTGIAHVLMGSVAERVVRLAPCPVLTIHGAETATAAAPAPAVVVV